MARLFAGAILTAGLMAGMFSMAETAGAEPIPAQWLQNQHDVCMKSCTTQQNADTAKCTARCDCASQQVSSSITMEEYMEFDQAMKGGKQPPQDVMDKIQNVLASCKAKVQ
jgi:hypothetical protein